MSSLETPITDGNIPCDADPLGEGLEIAYVQPLYADDAVTLLRAPSVATVVEVDPGDDFPRYPNRWFRGYNEPLRNSSGTDTFYKKPYINVRFGREVMVESVSYLGYDGFRYRFFKTMDVYADGVLVGGVKDRTWNDFLQWTKIELQPTRCTELKLVFTINLGDRAGITSLRIEGHHKP